MLFTIRLKNYFLRGLAVLLPSVLTIWIFVWGYKFIQENISVHIKLGLVKLMTAAGASESDLGELWVDQALSIAGFIVAVIAVCIVGALLASVVGKTLWRMIEKLIMNTPFLKAVYPYIKQVTDFLFKQPDQEKMSFSRVVAAEYPRAGVWSVGFVTGSGLKKVIDKQKKELLTVFIPTSPTPFTGFVIMVLKEETIDLDMTIEEAFRFTVSGGVVTPGDNQTGVVLQPASDSEGNK